MTDPYHIIVVEDDAVTRTKLAGYAQAAGHRVSEAEDGDGMWRILERDAADLILLDINLPREDGLDLTRKLRAQSSVGIILVTVRTDEADRIVGLEFGADDYVTKPFSPRELFARVKSVLRRAAERAREPVSARRFAGWEFSMAARKLVSPAGESVQLTRAEHELLAALADHPGQVLSRERLLAVITHRSWEPGDRTIDVLVRRLRRKIEQDPGNPELIVTAHGEGYVFTPAVTT